MHRAVQTTLSPDVVKAWTVKRLQTEHARLSAFVQMHAYKLAHEHFVDLHRHLETMSLLIKRRTPSPQSTSPSPLTKSPSPKSPSPKSPSPKSDQPAQSYDARHAVLQALRRGAALEEISGGRVTKFTTQLLAAQIQKTLFLSSSPASSNQKTPNHPSDQQSPKHDVLDATTPEGKAELRRLLLTCTDEEAREREVLVSDADMEIIRKLMIANETRTRR